MKSLDINTVNEAIDEYLDELSSDSLSWPYVGCHSESRFYFLIENSLLLSNLKIEINSENPNWKMVNRILSAELGKSYHNRSIGLILQNLYELVKNCSKDYEEEMQDD